MPDESEELALSEVDAWTASAAVAKSAVAAEVGEFGEGFFVGRVGGVEPAFGYEFVASRVDGFFAGD